MGSQLRGKQMAELMPACAAFPSSVEGKSPHWDNEVRDSADGIGSLE